MEKVYCMDRESSPAEIANLLNNNGNMWNNPFIYLVWMMMAGRNGWGYDGNNADISRQLQTLQNDMADNHNSDLIMSAVKGSENATRELASNLNCDFNALNTAICGVRSAVQDVAGKIGITGERVINSVLLGNKDLTSAIQNCCCTTQQNILKMGYENQLATQGQTSALMSRLDQLANGITQGFSATAYETQKQTCDIINNANANTQKLLDTMNAHWQEDLKDRLATARLELSQKNQNEYLVAQMKAQAGCGCN